MMLELEEKCEGYSCKERKLDGWQASSMFLVFTMNYPQDEI